MKTKCESIGCSRLLEGKRFCRSCEYANMRAMAIGTAYNGPCNVSESRNTMAKKQTVSAKAVPVQTQGAWEPLGIQGKNATALKRGNTVVIIIPDIDAHQYDGPKAPVFGMLNGKVGGTRDQRINLSVIGKSYAEGEAKLGGGVAENVKALREVGTEKALPRGGTAHAKVPAGLDMESLLRALKLT